MFSYAIRCALFCLVLGSLAHAGMTAETPYTDRGKTDFDTALRLLNPWGTWSKIEGKWAYTPRDHEAPYTEGRWLYTEYGWYWEGTLPHSWVTEHYGYWKRSANKVWSWFPGPFWLPQIVEIRATTKYIGWRTGEVDDEGSFVEAPIDRYSKPDEWTFVTLEQFANPITPALIAPFAVAKSQLEDSTDCRHTYLTYREIDRPGPHPADFTDLCRDGKMLAPGLFDDHLIAPTPTPSPALTNSTAVAMTGTNAPALMGAAIDPSADTRKVKYWVTMSLPTYWTAPPPDAKAGETYLYRPDFYQDQDGIERRITLWFNPMTRTTLKELLGKDMPGMKPGATTGGQAVSASPVVPAEAAEDSGSNPFRSPLDERFQNDTTSHAPNASTKAPSSANSNAAPSGLAPSGLTTPKIPAAPKADGVTPQ